ncbi:hypothetical protein BJF78_13545 [Pseudonocardia sp. CNS-139]|nr:hypothetical protein BJF78_13545 [Pseudonocardia sp. CNS-139]
MGTAEQAEAAVGALRARIDTVVAADHGGQRRAATLIVTPGAPVAAYGNQSAQHAQMEALGLVNIFADEEHRYFETSIEEVLDRDPEVIILLDTSSDGSGDPAADLAAESRLGETTAVRTGRILVVPYSFTSQSPIAIQGLEDLARQLAAVPA